VRVIRPAALADRRRASIRIGFAVAMLALGAIAAAVLTIAAPISSGPSALLGLAAALGLGLGAAWLVRAVRPDPARRLLIEIERLLRDAFDDSYTLIVGPRLPIRRTDIGAILVGPAGVRVLVARDWEGRYRVRGRGWEFDTRSRRGWIPCRTNPSFDAAAQAEAVSGWAREAGLALPAVAGAIVFPGRRSRIVLEQPDDEIVTRDNVPWWANRIGRVQRMDAASAARFVSAVLSAADTAGAAPATAARARL
jgi:hypothetical protein